MTRKKKATPSIRLGVIVYHIYNTTLCNTGNVHGRRNSVIIRFELLVEGMVASAWEVFLPAPRPEASQHLSAFSKHMYTCKTLLVHNRWWVCTDLGSIAPVDAVKCPPIGPDPLVATHASVLGGLLFAGYAEVRANRYQVLGIGKVVRLQRVVCSSWQYKCGESEWY